MAYLHSAAIRADQWQNRAHANYIVSTQLVGGAGNRERSNMRTQLGSLHAIECIAVYGLMHCYYIERSSAMCLGLGTQ